LARNDRGFEGYAFDSRADLKPAPATP
jgi:hypothetical protein